MLNKEFNNPLHVERCAVLLLCVLAASGFGLRAWGVSELGLAEDEINKLEAVRAYRRGDFTENAERPRRPAPANHL